MALRVKGRMQRQLAPGLYVVMYFDAEWEELTHLRLENAGVVEATEALETWFRERDLIRGRKVASSALSDAVAVTVGRADEED